MSNFQIIQDKYSLGEHNDLDLILMNKNLT